jgi:hypothetical protein
MYAWFTICIGVFYLRGHETGDWHLTKWIKVHVASTHSPWEIVSANRSSSLSTVTSHKIHDPTLAKSEVTRVYVQRLSKSEDSRCRQITCYSTWVRLCSKAVIVHAAEVWSDKEGILYHSLRKYLYLHTRRIPWAKVSKAYVSLHWIPISRWTSGRQILLGQTPPQIRIGRSVRVISVTRFLGQHHTQMTMHW